MEHGGPPEKWAATQCLALSGVITDKIIVELVNHLHADNAVRTEKAGTLLAKLSQQSVSFQSIIGVKTFSYETSNSFKQMKIIAVYTQLKQLRNIVPHY